MDIFQMLPVLKEHYYKENHDENFVDRVMDEMN